MANVAAATDPATQAKQAMAFTRHRRRRAATEAAAAQDTLDLAAEASGEVVQLPNRGQESPQCTSSTRRGSPPRSATSA
jgi:hypothetical protein